MAKKQTRTQSQATHHARLINQAKGLLTYLCNNHGELWHELDDAWPRGMGKTGLKAQLKKVNKQLNTKYKS